MHIFKLAGRVALRHRGLLALYVLMMAAFGLLMASYVGDDTSSYQETRPTVAVIDRDGSELSGALADFVLGAGTPVELPDTAYALQDAAAKDLATYVLVIPEGYGDALVRAAREGGAMPTLERSVSFQGAQGSLMDERARAFAQRLFALGGEFLHFLTVPLFDFLEFGLARAAQRVDFGLLLFGDASEFFLALGVETVYLRLLFLGELLRLFLDGFFGVFYLFGSQQFRSEPDVRQNIIVREKIETLKDHTEVQPFFAQRKTSHLLFRMLSRIRDLGQQFSVYRDTAAVGLFQKI